MSHQIEAESLLYNMEMFCNILVPVKGWKKAKNAIIGNFCHIFCHFSPPYRHQNITKHLHVVEEALSFDLVGHMWKLVEKWLQKWAKCETTSNFNTASTCVCSRTEIFGTLTEWVCLLWPDNIVRYTDSPQRLLQYFDTLWQYLPVTFPQVYVSN